MKPKKYDSAAFARQNNAMELVEPRETLAGKVAMALLAVTVVTGAMSVMMDVLGNLMYGL